MGIKLTGNALEKQKKRVEPKTSILQRGIPLLLVGAAGLVSGLIYAQPVHAEGSKDLIKNGGYRPYLEWNAASLSGIPRRSVVQVYAKEGETINLGSSVYSAAGNQDIVAVDPNGTSTVLDVVATGTGHIDTLSKEQNGLGLGGYTPHQIVVGPGQEGIWNIEFHNPDNPTSSPTPARTTDPFPVDENQGEAVAAWDVTVQAGGIDQPGRVFASYLALNMGSNATATYTDMELKSTLYILTKDGYRYETQMNGLDPYVFMFFANNRGFLHPNGTTLYHSINSPDAGASFSAGVTVQNPSVADTATNVTHHVFLNAPAGDLPPSMPTVAVPPAAPTNFRFEGNTGNASPVGAGGTFSFDTAQFGSFQIVVDTSGGPGNTPDGVYDPAVDVMLGNVAQAGHNTIVWNGKNRSGVNVPVRKYNAKLYVKSGEYHFPLIDAESSANGLKIELQNPPVAYPAHANMTTSSLFYDDSNYVIGATTIDLDPLFYQTVSLPRNASGGVDSTAGVHRYTAGYGDGKGIDTWTYFPSEAVYSSLVVTDATLTGTVYEDTDRDGTQDAGETGIAGVNVTLTDKNGDSVVLTTDATGGYSTNVLSGAVTVAVNPASAPLANFQLTTANASQSFTANVGANASAAVGYAPNRPPTTANINRTTPRDTAVSDTVTGTDPDGDTLTYTKATEPANGTAVLNGATGAFTYTPNLGYTGVDTFTVTVNDGKGGTVTATVTVTVTPPAPANQPPTTADISTTTPINTPVSGTITGADPDGDALTFTKTTDPANGTATVNATTGNWTYTPNPGFTGVNSFTVTVSDGRGGTAVATVTITVTAPPAPVNHPPTTADMIKTTPVNTPVAGSISSSDPDGDVLTHTKLSEPTHGTASVTPNGNWSYVPGKDFTGTDSFTVRVSDGRGGQATATVTIIIEKPVDGNQPPQVQDDQKETEIDTPVEGRLKATDPDQDLISFKKVTDPINGTVIVQADGQYEYTPQPGYIGTDTFDVLVSDGKGGTALATVTVIVNPPASIMSTTDTTEDTALDGGVDLFGFEDEEVIFEQTAKSEHGTVVLSTAGTWTYVPDPGFVGEDRFTITVKSKTNPLKKRSQTFVVRIAPKPVTPPVEQPNLQTLPKTGSPIDRTLLYGLGTVMVAAGGMLRFRRKRK